MILQSPKAFKAIALTLVFSVTQLCVQANLSVSKPAPKSVAATTEGRAPVGMLMVRGGSSVLLNGNDASAGTTVLSGAQIDTGKDVGANVQLGMLGSLDLDFNTSATILFNEGNVNVNLTKGCAFLKANKGVNGAVTTAAGAPALTDPLQNSTINACVRPEGGSLVVNQITSEIKDLGEDASAGNAASLRLEKSAALTDSQGRGRFDDNTQDRNDRDNNRDNQDRDNQDNEGNGLSRNGTIAIVSGAAAAAIVLGIVASNRGRGRNPSPGVPRGSQ
ncbi:MAG: hypothetical protein ABR577_05790 [Pyrinomonadaceae bacterium]